MLEIRTIVLPPGPMSFPLGHRLLTRQNGGKLATRTFFLGVMLAIALVLVLRLYMEESMMASRR